MFNAKNHRGMLHMAAVINLAATACVASSYCCHSSGFFASRSARVSLFEVFQRAFMAEKSPY